MKKTIKEQKFQNAVKTSKKLKNEVKTSTISINELTSVNG